MLVPDDGGHQQLLHEADYRRVYGRHGGDDGQAALHATRFRLQVELGWGPDRLD